MGTKRTTAIWRISPKNYIFSLIATFSRFEAVIFFLKTGLKSTIFPQVCRNPFSKGNTNLQNEKWFSK